MPRPLPRRRFARLCRRSDRATLLALLAACYRERGWEAAVHRSEGRLELRRGGERHTVAVERAGLRAPDPDPGVDTLFCVGRGRAPPGALGEEDVYELLFYGIDRGTCERLFEAAFGRSPYRRPPSRPERAVRGLGRRLAADPERTLGGAAALAVLLAVALLAVGLPGAPADRSDGGGPDASPSLEAIDAGGDAGTAGVSGGARSGEGTDATLWPADQNWPTAGAGMARTRSNPAAEGPLGNVTVRRSLTPAAGIAGAPILVNGTAYVSGYDGVLLAAGARTLSPRWAVETPGLSGVTPTAAAGAVYAASDSVVYATDLDAPNASGANRTRRVADVGATVAGAPAVAGGRVYVTTTRGRVVALDAETGAVRWNVSVGNRSLAPPAVAGGSVFVAHDGGVTALAPNGTVRWRWNASGVVAAPAAARGAVFAGTTNGTVAALDAESGEPRWTARTNGSVESGVAVAPVLGLAVVGDETGRLYAFGAANGTTRWVRSLDGAVAAAPAVAGRTLYAATRNGSVYGLTTLAGTVRWRTALGTPVVLPPAVADGALYVADASGALYALRGSRPTEEGPGESCERIEARYGSAQCRGE